MAILSTLLRRLPTIAILGFNLLAGAALIAPNLSCSRSLLQASQRNGNDGDRDADWSKLQTELARRRLEERHTEEFLSSGARCLSYDKCKTWVQKNGYGWKSQQEWEDFINAGESLQWFVPSNPEKHDTQKGTWLSWRDLLGV
jgi:hypothetical protein